MLSICGKGKHHALTTTACTTCKLCLFATSNFESNKRILTCLYELTVLWRGAFYCYLYSYIFHMHNTFVDSFIINWTTLKRIKNPLYIKAAIFLKQYLPSHQQTTMHGTIANLFKVLKMNNMFHVCQTAVKGIGTGLVQSWQEYNQVRVQMFNSSCLCLICLWQTLLLAVCYGLSQYVWPWSLQSVVK